MHHLRSQVASKVDVRHMTRPTATPVARSVVALSVLRTLMSPEKRANPSMCRLGADLYGPREPWGAHRHHTIE